MEVKFDDYKLEIQLEAQSPLIHFQPKEKGATVRASEVKPKLDKYILNKIKSKGIYKSEEDIKKSREYKDIFIDPDKNNALDYKMKIASVETYSFELEDGYKIYYGNRGAKNGKKEGFISDPTITIICLKN